MKVLKNKFVASFDGFSHFISYILHVYALVAIYLYSLSY